MIATILAQKVNPTAPGIIYSFFAVIAIIGLMISTQIHFDESTDSVTNEETDNGTAGSNIAFEQESCEKPDQLSEAKPMGNPIV